MLKLDDVIVDDVIVDNVIVDERDMHTSGGVYVPCIYTCMPGESYRRRLGSLLCLCDVFRALITSHVC